MVMPSLEASDNDERGPSKGLGRRLNRKIVFNKLHEIKVYLEKCGYSQLEIVLARYPLVRATDRPAAVQYQFVLCERTASQEELIKSYLEDYPQLKDVYFVVKAALDARGLSDPSVGGLGSYPLFVALVNALKRTNNSRKEPVEHLVNILGFYTALDTSKTCPHA